MAGGALKMASMDDLDLRMSEGVRPLYDAVVKFIAEEVDPITEEFYRLGENRAERWSWAPGQLELLEGAKAKAKAQGLWNFFLPNAETGHRPQSTSTTPTSPTSWARTAWRRSA